MELIQNVGGINHSLRSKKRSYEEYKNNELILLDEFDEDLINELLTPSSSKKKRKLSEIIN